MAPRTLFLPTVDSRGEGTASLRAAEWLSLGAAPAFAVMALLTEIHGGSTRDVFCSAMQDPSSLSGMIPMYALMSVFHLTPWLGVIRRRRSGRSREPSMQ
jgi:hypothetical protein